MALLDVAAAGVGGGGGAPQVAPATSRLRSPFPPSAPKSSVRRLGASARSAGFVRARRPSPAAVSPDFARPRCDQAALGGRSATRRGCSGRPIRERASAPRDPVALIHPPAPPRVAAPRRSADRKRDAGRPREAVRTAQKGGPPLCRPAGLCRPSPRSQGGGGSVRVSPRAGHFVSFLTDRRAVAARPEIRAPLGRVRGRRRGSPAAGGGGAVSLGAAAAGKPAGARAGERGGLGAAERAGACGGEAGVAERAWGGPGLARPRDARRACAATQTPIAPRCRPTGSRRRNRRAPGASVWRRRARDAAF